MLLLQQRKPLPVAKAMCLVGRGPMRLLMGVEDLQGEDRESVDDQPRGLGVERRRGILLNRLEQVPVDLLDEIVAPLIEGVDGSLHSRQCGVRRLRITRIVFAVPKIEVGAMLLEREVFQGGGRERISSLGEVPKLRGTSLQTGDVHDVEHRQVRHGPWGSIAGMGPHSKPVASSVVRRLHGLAETATLNDVSDGVVKRVLIYRLGSLGDTLVALPALHLVARAFPQAERRMLTNSPVHAKAPAAAAVLEGMGLVQGYLRYTVGTRDLRELLRLWWEIWRFRPQVVVYLAAARGEAAAARDVRFFRLCGAKRVIGAPLTGAMQANFGGAEPGSTDAQQRLADANLEPEAARLARNLRELGDAALDAPGSWSLHLSPAEQRRAEQAIGAEALRTRPIAVSVGTKVQAKDWGRENWQALLTRLAKELPGRGLLLLGAPEESEASLFASSGWRLNGGGPVVNLCGGLTPRESAAAIARASLFLGHDSGPMHLAAAVGTPLVALFAARNIPRQWFPYGSRYEVVYHRVECWGCGLETCIEQRKKCILSITADEVLDKVRLLLSRSDEVDA